MFHGHMEGMVIGYCDFLQIEPAIGTLSTPFYRNLLGNHSTHEEAPFQNEGLLGLDPYLRVKVFLKEYPNLFPTIHGLLLSIVGAVVVEESMSGTWIHVKIIYLSMVKRLFKEAKRTR